MTVAFHLNNREAKRREPKVHNNDKLLQFCLTPTYRGVNWTNRSHFVGAKALHTASLSLVFSTDEYCALIWCRSAHTRLIDNVLNYTLPIVTGCLRPVPTDYLPILLGIQSVELCQLRGTLSLTYRGSLHLDYILYRL